MHFWCHLGDFGRHLGPSWAPRGGPKSHFSGKIPEKMRKKEVREPFGEKHEKTSTFNDEPLRTKEAPEAYRSMLPSKYEVLAGHDFSCFLVLKRHGKSIKSGTFGARGPDFPDFSRIFER